MLACQDQLRANQCLRQNKEEFQKLQDFLNVPVQDLREQFCNVGSYMFSGGGGTQHNWKNLEGLDDATWAEEWRKQAID